MNTTCGLDGHQCTGPPHPQFSIPAPDVAMQGVARYKDRYFSQELFYEQAANGSLPQFVWFNPPFQASDHPCQDVAKGVSMIVVRSLISVSHLPARLTLDNVYRANAGEAPQGCL